jgi:hypothetical protein
MNAYERGFSDTLTKQGVRGAFVGKLIDRGLEPFSQNAVTLDAVSKLKPMLEGLKRHDIARLAPAADRARMGHIGINTTNTGSTNDNIINIIKMLKHKIGPVSSFDKVVERGNRTANNILGTR